MTRDEALAALRDAGIPDAATDVRRLWAHACAQGDPSHWFKRAVEARLTRKPVAQIVGQRDFWKGSFIVTPDVLDPRPETEVLVELALSEPFSKVLDLGTGSGCILISLLMERPDAHGVGCDISEQAVLVAGENAARHGVADRMILPVSDWFDDIGGRFDLIVSNPPYIAADEMTDLSPDVREHEPRIALTDEGDGLAAYRAIARSVLDHLAASGRLLVEIGPTQAKAVTELFVGAGLEDVQVHPDLDGRDRVVAARAPS